MSTLERLEVPRHVHKTDGTWKHVENHAELAAAVAEGWLVDPNAGPVPYNPYGTVTIEPAWQAPSEPQRVSTVAVETARESLPDEQATNAVESDADFVEVAEAPKKRGPGRPRKGA